MKRILYKLGIINLVWLQDSDGETLLRRVLYGSDGKRYAYRYEFWYYESSKALAELKPNGTVSCPESDWCKKWFKYENRPEDPKKPKKLKLSGWYCLGRNKAIEMAERLEK